MVCVALIGRPAPPLLSENLLEPKMDLPHRREQCSPETFTMAEDPNAIAVGEKQSPKS